MSQGDIIELLRKKKEPLTSRELSEYLKVRQETIIKALKRMVKFHEVDERRINKKEIIDKGYLGKKINSRFMVYSAKLIFFF